MEDNDLCAVCQDGKMLSDLWVCASCFDRPEWPALPIPLPCLFPENYNGSSKFHPLEKSLQLLRGCEHHTKNLQKMRVQTAVTKAFRNSYDKIQKDLTYDIFKDGYRK
jgi:hypothetical protein